MIIEKVQKYMQSQIKAWPCKVNRASEIGHPCERYLVFMRTRWEEKALHDVGLQFVFREGQDQEKAVLRLLMDADVEVFEQQRPFDWKEKEITGHIDGKVMIDGEVYPLEIKSMAPWIFDKINSVEDMLHGKWEHLKRYPAQLTLYMLMDGKEHALFLLKNKSTGQLKEILVPLDYEYAESLVQKIERVNEHVANKTVPEPIPWDDTCDKCGFRHVCARDVAREELEFREDPEAEEKIDGWFELKPWNEKWKELDEWKKEYFRNIKKMVIGPYLIMGKPLGDKGWKVTISKV